MITKQSDYPPNYIGAENNEKAKWNDFLYSGLIGSGLGAAGLGGLSYFKNRNEKDKDKAKKDLYRHLALGGVLGGVTGSAYGHFKGQSFIDSQQRKPETTGSYPKLSESTGAENNCQGGGFVKYRCSADKKREKPVGKIDQLRSEWYNKGVF